MAMDLPPSIGLPNGPRVDPPRGRLVNIAILGGTGKEGAGLAIRWALAGHSIIIGSRDAERARGKAAELREITKKRSEEHTSELQSHSDLVCRLLLEKKKRRRESHHRHEEYQHKRTVHVLIH